MARYTGPVCRLCRREGIKLFLKGDRCYTDKCSITKRTYAPGQHGKSRKKLSEYGVQLREKQKVRRYYGVLESQFEKYFELANKKAGVTGENLLQILESRLDNVAYRAGFALSRPEARQLVNHGHFTVNGRKVNIPSFLVKAGDNVAFTEKSKGMPKIKSVLEKTEGKVIPKWIELDSDNKVAKIVALADRDDIDLQIQETLIVEYYSK
jgi:small subunit ribosomal protein S4